MLHDCHGIISFTLRSFSVPVHVLVNILESYSEIQHYGMVKVGDIKKIRIVGVD